MTTTEKSEAISLLSDIYKDAYGFRPRTVYNYDAMSIDDINAEIDAIETPIEGNVVFTMSEDDYNVVDKSYGNFNSEEEAHKSYQNELQGL